MSLKSYRELIVWQRGMELAELIYKLTKEFPKEELYGLTSQVRRAAVSVPSNIAEGQGRNSTKEFRNHLSMAYGSLQELETQILLAHRLGYLKQEGLQATLSLSGEVGRLINALSSSLLRRLDTTTKHRPPTTDH
ncbi:MAG: four helix bundle protein [Candidatus Omnitrophica bacterium]|nr:four helix bundle protein [Candidatus Omnitrophota bacterium]